MAKKKIYPTLWWLYRDDLLPTKTLFLGYARSKLEIKEFLTKTSYEYMKVKPGQEAKFAEFVELNSYLSGSYDKAENFKQLNEKIFELSRKHASRVNGGQNGSSSNSNGDALNGGGNETADRGVDCNRIFYLALPPTVYMSVTKLLSDHCKSQKYVLLTFFSLSIRVFGDFLLL